METKICSKCKKELPIENFNFRNKAKGTRRAECKECHSKFMKDVYKKKKEEIQEIKASHTCAKCGDTRGYVLDFHHINPENKIDTIARLTSNTYNMDIVKAEMKKCIVLCSNCHREYHFLQEQNKDLTIEEYLTMPSEQIGKATAL